MIVIGLYHWQGGWDLRSTKSRRSVLPLKRSGSRPGVRRHLLGWRGLRSRRPGESCSTATKGPERGLVLVDGVNGEIIDRFVEDNPEDWSGYDV